MHKPGSVLDNEALNSMGFWNTNGLSNCVQKTRPKVNYQKEKSWKHCGTWKWLKM